MRQKNNQLAEGVTLIGGNEYKEVWKRRNEFLKDIGFTEFIKDKELSSLSHVTTVMEENDQFIHMVCDLTVSFGSDENSVTVQGHGRLYKTGVQSKDAFLIEKCETRAFGRALAVLDYSGKNMASAEEMEDVQANEAEIKDQELKAQPKAEVVKAEQVSEPSEPDKGSKPQTDQQRKEVYFEEREAAVRFDLLGGIGTFKDRLLELGMTGSAIGKLWIDEFGHRTKEELSVDELSEFYNTLEDSIKVLEAEPDQELIV